MNKNIESFINRYNDFDCVFKNHSANECREVYHYTKSPEAVISICKGEFHATDMLEFRSGMNGGDDKKEGILLFEQLFGWLSQETIKSKLRTEDFDKISRCIGSDEAIEQFVHDRAISYVLSTSSNADSEYLWGIGRTDYRKYKICIDPEILRKGLRTELNNSDFRSVRVRYAYVIYSEQEQKSILEKEFLELLKLLNGTGGSIGIEYVLYHLIYVGNFFKRTAYSCEEEIRFVLNTYASSNEEILNILPLRPATKLNEKKYVKFLFQPAAINGIECANAASKYELENLITSERQKGQCAVAQDIPITIRLTEIL